MSWSLKEAVEKVARDPQERMKAEEYLKSLGDSNPEESRIWRAKIEGDVKTVDKILTARAIARTKERLKQQPSRHNEKHLAYLTERLKQLEVN